MKTETYIIHPWGVSRCFVFDKQLNLRDSYIVKTKAFSNAFYMYVPCPLSTPGAFCRCMTMQMYKFILRILLVGHENDRNTHVISIILNLSILPKEYRFVPYLTPLIVLMLSLAVYNVV